VYYKNNELLKQGYIGSAYTILINANKAYEIGCGVLENNPKITLCDNPSCMLCRARRWDNLKDMTMYIVRYLISMALNKLRG
jgi:hypothetical protein